MQKSEKISRIFISIKKDHFPNNTVLRSAIYFIAINIEISKATIAIVVPTNCIRISRTACIKTRLHKAVVCSTGRSSITVNYLTIIDPIIITSSTIIGNTCGHRVVGTSFNHLQLTWINKTIHNNAIRIWNS